VGRFLICTNWHKIFISKENDTPMDKITELQQLLKEELKDLYSAETQLVEALPEMAEKASHPKLKKAFNDHLAVTKQQRKRLEQVQKLLNEPVQKKENKGFFAKLFSSDEGEEHCKAMEGLIKEAKHLMDEDMSLEVMDAALIAAAQKVEHYEIASYGTARAYAKQLGLAEVEKLLSATLAEEYDADDSLTKLAVSRINLDAETSDEKTETEDSNKKVLSPKKTAVSKKAAKIAPAKKAAKRK
jgi:ferritin-like metal-binding protein YciE